MYSGIAPLSGWLALRVLADLSKVDQDARLITDDLGVMTPRDSHDVAGADLGLAAVVHVDLHPAREAVAEVRDLARVGLRYRLHVFRPSPTGPKGAAADGVTGH